MTRRCRSGLDPESFLISCIKLGKAPGQARCDKRIVYISSIINKAGGTLARFDIRKSFTYSNTKKQEAIPELKIYFTLLPDPK
jgi:hypothetical protein